MVDISTVTVRPAHSAEIDALGALWHDSWHDAHAEILPAELKRRRTLQSFRDRIERLLASVRVAGEPGAPLGFHILKGDELYQFYVRAEARGTGVAAALMRDAEARFLERGLETAWLACAIDNRRAARFYEKCGWRLAGNMISNLETPEGVFPLEVWRYEKRLQ